MRTFFWDAKRDDGNPVQVEWSFDRDLLVNIRAAIEPPCDLATEERERIEAEIQEKAHPEDYLSDDEGGCGFGYPPPTEPVGTPLSELSGRPGSYAYERFKAIAASWGYD